MQSGGHFSHGTRFGKDEIAAIFARSGSKRGAVGEAFLDSAVVQSLRQMVPGKRVLDIGCGVGDWCCRAAQYGAKSVNGFDIEEEMVKLAKQATSHLDMVHIKAGDVSSMPYDDASFDVAISLFVTCNLSPEAFAKHFQELYRVLVPGGKAILQIPTDWSHSGLYTKIKTDPAVVETEIAQILKMVPKHPTTAQVTEAFKNANDIIIACFAVDSEGSLFRIKHINQVNHGQPIWRKTEVMMWPNFFYSDHSNIIHALTAGFHIDSIENHFTEERIVAYNSKKPDIPLNRKYTENPLALVYHVSKPFDM